MPGFVRVSGYNQTDMDNNYQSGYNDGITYADGRANPSSVNYQTGYNAGITYADGRANPSSVNYQTGYNAGIEYADGRSNPDSVNYQSGFRAGANKVTGSPAIVLASGHPINTDSEDSLNIHIYNNTSNTLTAIITGSLNGATGTNVKTLNGEDIGFISDGISVSFPPNGDFHFAQDYNGGATNKEGNLYITVIGDYNTFDNQIIRNAGTDGTTGTATFY